MADIPAEPVTPEESATPDLAQGYCIEVSVLPDGTFNVAGPEPLEADAAEGSYNAGEGVQSVGEALKAVLSIIKANPVGGSDQDQFSAGYGTQGG